jgi:hypothetical protein
MPTAQVIKAHHHMAFFMISIVLSRRIAPVSVRTSRPAVFQAVQAPILELVALGTPGPASW